MTKSTKIHNKTAELDIKDVLCELKEENERLGQQILFANKCIQLLTKFRNCLTLFSSQCICSLNAHNKQTYTDLQNEYDIIGRQISDGNAIKSECKINNNNNTIHDINEQNLIANVIKIDVKSRINNSKNLKPIAKRKQPNRAQPIVSTKEEFLNAEPNCGNAPILGKHLLI